MENNSTVMPSWKNGSISIIRKLQENVAERFGPNFERIPYDLWLCDWPFPPIVQNLFPVSFITTDDLANSMTAPANINRDGEEIGKNLHIKT